MKFHNIFLKIFGLKGIIGNSGNNGEGERDIEIGRIELSIDNSGKLNKKIIKKKIPFYRNVVCKNLINWLYILFVMCSISWLCIFSIIKSGIKNDFRYVFSNMFAFMYLAQYILGIILYRNKFISKSMRIVDEKDKITLLLLYIISCIIVILLTATSIALLIMRVNINIYSELYESISLYGKILLCIALSIERVYSYGIFFMNVILFSYILINHSKNINSYQQKLDLIVQENINDISIIDIIKEYTELKEYYANSVELLNNLFSSITIFGLLGCYFAIMNFSTTYVGAFTYIDMICFIVVEGVYIYSINRIKKSANDIMDIISSSRFIIRFLDRNDLGTIYGDIYDDYAKENSITSDRYTKDSQIIYVDMSSINSSNGKKDKEDKNNISTPIVSTQSNSTPILSTPSKSISRRSITKKVLIETVDEFAKSKPDLNKKINIIKTILLRTSITTNENANELDWIILYSKLSEDWENFKVFGFEIDDATIIQKLIIVIFGFIGILRLNNKMGF